MRSNRHLVTALTVALALGAAAAPAFAQSSRWVVRPNPDEQTAAALATFNASNHSSPTAPAPEVRPNPDEQTAAALATFNASNHSSPTAPATIVHVTSPSGFDWSDAGIGAAGGFALSMLGLGLALVVSQRRTRRSGSPPVTAG